MSTFNKKIINQLQMHVLCTCKIWWTFFQVFISTLCLSELPPTTNLLLMLGEVSQTSPKWISITLSLRLRSHHVHWCIFPPVILTHLYLFHASSRSGRTAQYMSHWFCYNIATNIEIYSQEGCGKAVSNDVQDAPYYNKANKKNVFLLIAWQSDVKIALHVISNVILQLCWVRTLLSSMCRYRMLHLITKALLHSA